MNFLTSLSPVFVFLLALVFLDSFKLVSLRSILLAIVAGCAAAGVSLVINSTMLYLIRLDLDFVSRYIAPVIEESLKSCYILYLLRKKRIGFIVDAAIYGSSVGAGFALIENLFYLWSIPSATLFVWIIRGFGTALMHSGTTAIFSIISKQLCDRRSSESMRNFFPGILSAVILHSFYNHFFFSPFISAIVLVVVLPVTFLVVFDRSERATETWLKVGFDTDVQVLDMIMTETLAETNVGSYLQSLKGRFSGEILVDMLCLLRLHLELSIRAKGILLMRQSGFDYEIDQEVRQKFAELEFLEKSIGVTGKLAMAPLIHASSRDLWQLYMLQNE